MKIIGLTGGIATGKSTTSRLFATYGIPIIDADLIARNVLTPNHPAYRKVLSEFSSFDITTDGTIDRKKLGSVIFNDSKCRKILNSIIHPYVIMEMIRGVCWELIMGRECVVLDIPLLFETGLNKYVQTTVLVYCDESSQLERLMKRDGITREEATTKVNAQMSIEKKKQMADVIIDNSGDPENLEKNVKQVYASQMQQNYLRKSIEWVILSPLALVALVGLQVYAWLDSIR